MAELSIGGETFNVEVEGSPTKPALVLSHALGTTLALWEPQMPALLRHFRVIRYDSRGHGGSTAGQAPYSIAQLGRDVLAILDALEIDRTHFLGMSMGGAVGQWLLVNAPERIERAILSNTAARLSTAASWNARIRSVLGGDMEGNAAKTIERWFGTAFLDDNADTIEAFRTTLRTMSSTGYAGSCAALRDMDFHESLRGVRHPVLVISGSDDPVTSENDIAVLTGALPNARHVALRARHIANVEAADAFTDEVVKFLTSRVPVRAIRRAAPPTRATPHVSRGSRRTGARASTAARRPAVAMVAKTPRAKPVPAKAARKAKPAAPPAKTPKPAKVTPAARKPAAKKPIGKTASTGAGARKAVTSKTAVPAARRLPLKPASTKPASLERATAKTVKPKTVKPKTVTAATRKSSVARAPAKVAPGKRVSGTAITGKSSPAPRTKPKTAAQGVAKVAPSRRKTPAARPAKAVGSKKAPGKTVAQNAASKATRTSTKVAAPRRKPPTSAGRPTRRGIARSAGRGTGRGKGRGKS